MKGRKARTLDAGGRVQAFLDDNAAAIGGAVSAVVRAKFDAAVSRLAQAERDQTFASDIALGETAAGQLLRQDVYDRYIAPIGRAAQIALHDTTEFTALVMPAELRQKRAFIAKASAVLEAAAKHEPVLIEHGLAPDFLAQLKAAIAQVEAAKASRGNQVTKRTTATGAIESAGKAVIDFIALLDRLLTPTLRANPALKAGWKSAKAIHKLPVTPLNNGNDAAGDVAPAVPPSPVSTPALVATTQSAA